MRAVRGFVVALLVVTLLPHSAAHDGHADRDQLIEDGQKLVVGRFTAAQPGPLVVVPYVDEPTPCGAYAPEGVTLPLGSDSAITFFTNETGLQAVFGLPDDASKGTIGLAVDTHSASRALILMQENAIAFHALTSVVWGPEHRMRTGVLGVPYVLPDQAHEHDFDFQPEGGGLLMAHDDSFRGGAACVGTEPGHRAIGVTRASLPGSLAPGSVVHVVAYFDPVVADFLPRPIDESTRVLQANLYLMRPGEDATTVRQAFAPSWDALDVAPLAFLALGLGWAARPRR